MCKLISQCWFQPGGHSPNLPTLVARFTCCVIRRIYSVYLGALWGLYIIHSRTIFLGSSRQVVIVVYTWLIRCGLEVLALRKQGGGIFIPSILFSKHTTPHKFHIFRSLVRIKFAHSRSCNSVPMWRIVPPSTYMVELFTRSRRKADGRSLLILGDTSKAS